MVMKARDPIFYMMSFMLSKSSKGKVRSEVKEKRKSIKEHVIVPRNMKERNLELWK